MSEPARRRATWEDLFDVPEGRTGEIVNGELRLLPRPAPPHSETASDLGGLLTPPFRFGRGGPGGWVLVDEPELELLEDIRVPDLVGWRRERYERPTRGPYTVIPDWICEVLSPSTAVTDRVEKLPLYARAGVPYVWLVDPLGFSLEVYRRVEEGYLLVLTAQGHAMLRIPPFEAIEFELGLLWGDRYDPTTPHPRDP